MGARVTMLPVAGQLGVPVHLHTAFPANRWSLLSTVTSAMSWLTLRRDRPNRSAMPAGSSGAPAAIDTAHAARTACFTSPGTSGTLVDACGLRERRTSCMTISTASLNAAAGQAETWPPACERGK
jgi:hypothetical protein